MLASHTCTQTPDETTRVGAEPGAAQVFKSASVLSQDEPKHFKGDQRQQNENKARWAMLGPIPEFQI